MKENQLTFLKIGKNYAFCNFILLRNHSSLMSASCHLTGYGILILKSKVEVFIYFLFLLDQKSLNTQQQKSFDIQHQFQHLTPCSNYMIPT